MNKRLITASFAVAAAVLTTPASARPFDADRETGRYQFDHSDDETRGRRHHVDRDDDDRENFIRRKRHTRETARRPTRTEAQRVATAPDAAPPPSVAARSITQHAYGGAGTARGCLTGPTQALLTRIEATFGPVRVISTCRPGARIAGTGRISKHASGQAVDFEAGGRKAEIVRWLIANHKSGGTMTYAGMSHIHVDVGYHFVALNSGRGR
jgi:hypothetical protein